MGGPPIPPGPPQPQLWDGDDTLHSCVTSADRAPRLSELTV